MKIVEEALQEFFLEPTNRVAVLKGEWGVGKTYFWKNYAKGLPERFLGKVEKVSYVSLFGIENVSQLRAKILEGMALDTPDEQPGLFSKGKNFITNNLKSFQKLHKLGDVLHPIIEARLIRETVVCIDDLERKHDKFPMKLLLGAVSDLTEQLSCKVVLIYNENKLEDEDIEIFEEYREKVIDAEYEYAPSIEDNLNIVWQNGAEDWVSRFFYDLELNNLRIMQKVKTNVGVFSGRLDELPPQILQPALRLTAAKTIGHFGFRNEIKDFKLFDSISIWARSTANEAESDEEKEALRIQGLLFKGFSYEVLPFSEIIQDYLTTGLIPEEELKSLIATTKSEAMNAEIRSVYSQIWNDIRGSFQVNQENLIERLVSFIKNHREALNLSDLRRCQHFLKEMKLDEKPLSSLPWNWEDAVRIDLQTDELNRHSRNLERHIENYPDHLKEIARKQLNEHIPDFSLSEVINMLAGSDSWDSTRLTWLEKHTVDEILEWLKTPADSNSGEPDKPWLCGRFLERFPKDSFSNKLNQALDQLEKVSELNKSRVSDIRRRV